MRRTVLGLVVAVCLAPSFASKPTVPATWGLETIGKDCFVVLDDPPVSLTAANDGASLVLVFRSNDPDVGRLALAGGLKLELSVKGEPPLVIAYPRGNGGPPTGGRDRTHAAPHAEGEPPAEPPSRPEEDPALATFDVHAGSGEPQHVELTNELGISPRMTLDERSFVYEVRVPLVRDAAHPYALGAKPGASISVTLGSKAAPHAGPPPGGMGGGGMNHYGGMGGSGGGHGTGPPGGVGAPSGNAVSSPVRAKATVVLAKH